MDIKVTCPKCKLSLVAPFMASGRSVACPHCRTLTDIPLMERRSDAQMAPDSQSNPSFTRDSSTMKQMTATYQGAGHPVVWYIGQFCYVESTDGNPMALELSQLQELVISLVNNQQESCLIIGFDKSSHVGSAMMGLLIKMNKIISDDDGHFGVIVRNENTLKSFKIVKLDTMMPIFSSLRNLLTELRFGPESEVHLEPMD